MIYKLSKIAIKLKRKIETGNRPVEYTNMYLDLVLNFFATGLFRNVYSKCLETKGRNLETTYFVFKDICVKHLKFALC